VAPQIVWPEMDPQEGAGLAPVRHSPEPLAPAESAAQCWMVDDAVSEFQLGPNRRGGPGDVNVPRPPSATPLGEA
jgi:hypothetical protein